MTGARRIILYTEQYLEEVFDFITAADMGYFLAAYNSDDRMVGGLVLIKDGKKLHYLIAATDPEFRKLPLSHLTIFEAIKLAKQVGCDYFDFGSHSFYANENDQLFKVNNFKLEFGGKLVFHPRCFHLVTNRFTYASGNFLLDLKKRLANLKRR